jgi:hypothetical protein
VEKTTYEELNYLYSSPDVIKVIIFKIIRWAGHVACRGEDMCIQGKPEGKRPLQRHRHGWDDNIKMDFLEV